MRKNPLDSRGYLSKNFRDTFSRTIEVEFVGIWDTVSSVGFFPRRLPNTSKNPIVKHVRHAVSLDERRAKFKSNLWSTLEDEYGEVIDVGSKDQNGIPERKRSVKEVWFAGGHGDVGGGWVAYKEEAALSRIPLRWVIREATENSSILWNDKFLEAFRVRKPEKGKALDDYIAKEKADALSVFHSAFAWNNLWWTLEVIPLIVYFRFLGIWVSYLRPNLWRPRKIRKPTEHHPTMVHSSVKTRLKHYRGKLGQRYHNAAQWDPKMTVFEDEWALPSDVQ